MEDIQNTENNNGVEIPQTDVNLVVQEGVGINAYSFLRKVLISLLVLLCVFAFIALIYVNGKTIYEHGL